MNRRPTWRGPAEGWTSLLLLALLAFLVGFAVDDAKWVLERDRLTDFLPAAAILGTLVGFATAQAGWGRLRAHLATAVAAALVVPVLVGSALQPDQGDIPALYRATAESTVNAFLDLVVQGRGSTIAYGHYILVLGLVVWATGHFAAYAVYRHHRPFSAVIALGLALVVNMSLTTHEQLPMLVLFSICALLLLVDLHAFDERREWMRRRIGDAGPLASLTLRGGAAFVGAAVIGSLFLTTTAQSAPLKDAWIGAEPWLVDAGRTLQRILPFVTRPRGPAGVSFDATAEITQTWTTDGAVAAVVTRTPGDHTGYYWRAATYDRFLGHSWVASDPAIVPEVGSQDLLKGSAEAEADTAAGRTKVTVTVEPKAYPGPQVLAPNTPVSVDLPTTVSLIGKGGFVASIAAGQRGASYTVTSMYPTFGDTDPKAITGNKLRVAGRDYPVSMAPYLVKSELGPASLQLLAEVRSKLTQDTPYDWADTMVAVLRNSTEFHYDTDISSLDCSNLSAVECFARYKRGFCQYYASTMAVLLREEGIPTRLVQGFLPGHLIGDTEEIFNSNSHAWVEVWFPGYGWVDFDPTGNVAQLAPILPGRAVVTPSPTPSRSPGDTGNNVDPSRRLGSISPNAGGGSSPGSPGSAPFIVVGLLLVATMGWLAFAAYRRGPRDITAEGAWGSVTGLAGRLGFGQRPTQTVYEYSAVLGDLLPGVRPELETVAQAKVEVAYGRRALGEDRLLAIRSATGRLRVGLLRLALRRPRRRRR